MKALSLIVLCIFNNSLAVSYIPLSHVYPIRDNVARELVNWPDSNKIDEYITVGSWQYNCIDISDKKTLILSSILGFSVIALMSTLLLEKPL